MRNVKLRLEYDGTEFSGWQYQTNGRSVQAALEIALKELLQEDVRVNGAGRTDAGVHARGQVASFFTGSKVDVEALQRGVNALLPDDIVVHSAEDVPEEFHARYSARARRYTYHITAVPRALGRAFAWFVGYSLDVSKMQECAAVVIGNQDFEAFCKAGSTVEHYRCEVSRSSWSENGALLEFEIVSNRFLYGMVRGLVGTMVDVGRGYRSVAEFRQILASKDRRNAGMSAPAKGLILEEIYY